MVIFSMSVRRRKQNPHHPMMLLILDGWGIAPPSRGNAISLAHTPVLDALTKRYPSTKLHASGRYVGLPQGYAGNSEAGHLNIGAGRIVEQDAVVISRAISQGSFFRNPVFIQAIQHVKKYRSRFHLMGLVTLGKSGHSQFDHLLSCISLLRIYKIKRVFLHLFTDGRDSVPHAALKIIGMLQGVLKHEKIVTLMGRFYAMDRKKYWARTAAAYHALTLGEGKHIGSAQEAIMESYRRGETDEYIPPYILDDRNLHCRIADNDAVIFFNLRSDRARQLTKPFVQEKFESLNPQSFIRRKRVKNIFFVAMTDFGPDLPNVHTAYPTKPLVDTLPMLLFQKKQIYITESEKYAHMTYFINGGYPDPVANEVRVKIDSPNVKFYDETPKMAVQEITNEAIQKLDTYDFIAVNFSSPDMVAHTGNIQATIKAIEFVDSCIGRLSSEILRRDGVFILTADHGNAERMIDFRTNLHITEHTTNPVPFIIVSKRGIRLRKKMGILADILPTLLDIFSLPQPDPVTGKSLIASIKRRYVR